MPSLTRWMLRAALGYFAAALALGALMAAQSPLALPSWLGVLRPTVLHLLVVGWVTQLIFGVVYWMFPKASSERPRGSPALGWATFGLLNSGLLARSVAEPLRVLHPQAARWAWVLVAAALLQWLAGMAFVANTWGRVRER